MSTNGCYSSYSPSEQKLRVLSPADEKNVIAWSSYGENAYELPGHVSLFQTTGGGVVIDASPYVRRPHTNPERITHLGYSKRSSTKKKRNSLTVNFLQNSQNRSLRGRVAATSSSKNTQKKPTMPLPEITALIL